MSFFRLRSPRRPPVGPPHGGGVLEHPLLLPRRYTTLFPLPVTVITITKRILGSWDARSDGVADAMIKACLSSPLDVRLEKGGGIAYLCLMPLPWLNA